MNPCMRLAAGAVLSACCLAAWSSAARALEVESVKFGAGDRWADITAPFVENAKKSDSFYRTWLDAFSLAGGKDPAPGVAKSVVINYRDAGGAAKVLSLGGDKHMIVLADDWRPTGEFKLSGAWYGRDKSYIDAADVVRRLLADGKKVKLTNALFGGKDPVPGRRKELFVLFSLDGEAVCSAIMEGEQFVPSHYDGRGELVSDAAERPSPFAGVALDRAVWQYSCRVPESKAGELGGKPARAFLWLPERSDRLRALVVGQFNMLEQPIMEQAALRDELARVGVGCVWLSPSLFGANFDPDDPEQGRVVQNVFDELARVSGRPELATIPFVGIGHSAMANFPWQLAAWKPERALAGVSVSGTFPDVKLVRDGKHRLAGIPCLTRMGEYENAGDYLKREDDGRLVTLDGNGWKFGKAVRTQFPDVPVSFLPDPGAGHFDYHDELCRQIGRFVAKAVQYRMDGGDPAKPLKAVESAEGYSYAPWHRVEAPKSPPVRASAFKGKRGFWTFDEESAREYTAFSERFRGKKVQLLGLATPAGVIEQNRKLHSQVRIKWTPGKDGLSMPLRPVFIDTVPEGRPQGWLKENGKDKNPGDPAPHGADDGLLRLRPICGPVEILDAGTAAIRFNRIGFDNPRRRGEIWLFAEHPGNGEYRRMVQQADANIPFPLGKGIWQRIDFPQPADVKAGVTSLKLAATANSGLPVSYYVEHGPAYLVGDELRFTPAPDNRYPIEVSVVAWQYGCADGVQVRSAVPVRRTFRIIP